MSGSLFSAALTFVLGLVAVAVIGAGFIWIVPILILALIPLLGGSLFSKVRNSSVVQDEPSGIPSTRDSSYVPTFDPSDRST